MGSQHRHIKLGLAALLLTSWLGTSGWAQAADETQPKGKIEARSELFAKDH
ncbi:MAG: ammonia-forming cytochrome c nitrite reductase subunit c552, partial [Aeromonas veronii]